MSQLTKDHVRIVEEVPGVPDDERWFICGGPFKADFAADHAYPHFSTAAEAEQFLRDRRITKYVIENFEP